MIIRAVNNVTKGEGHFGLPTTISRNLTWGQPCRLVGVSLVCSLVVGFLLAPTIFSSPRYLFHYFPSLAHLNPIPLIPIPISPQVARVMSFISSSQEIHASLFGLILSAIS